MRISKIILKGFRSFGAEVQIPILEKLTAFIGVNSSGKTTALEALRKIFGHSSERDLIKEDFHFEIGKDPTEVKTRDLFIEVQFVFSDSDSESIAHFFSDMVVDDSGLTPYIRIRLEATWSESEMHQEGEIDTRLYFINVGQGVPESEESKRPFPNYLRQLIQIIYVPAIRKPADQIKYASGSMLYRVLRKIKWDKTFKKKFEAQIKEVGLLFSDLDEFNVIQKSINTFWSQFHKDPRYKETSLGFGQSDFESVLKRMEVSFSPSAVDRPFKVDELGEGYRSLFYLTLVCALLEVEEKLSKPTDEIGIARPLITLLAIEEPENHIAPQLLGRVTTILERISKTDSAQIFLSSHTPAIVKRLTPESICHFRITDNYQTEVNTIVLPKDAGEVYKYVKEAVYHYPEMYFARLVVIGEGDSEQVIIEKLTEVLDVDFDDNLITFAPLGHRFVEHIWRLLEALKIPYVTILDLDLEREGGGWGRIKYASIQLLKIGVERTELFTVDGGGLLSNDEIREMHKWPVDYKIMAGWIERLENFNVFFSSPLDIDFIMLEYYPDFYKAAIPLNGGPTIPDKAKDAEKFKDKVEAALHATLKSEKAKGIEYDETQKELMIWYQYHFLGRGKPVTHILTFAKMTNDDIKKDLPPVLKRLFKAIGKKIKGA